MTLRNPIYTGLFLKLSECYKRQFDRLYLPSVKRPQKTQNARKQQLKNPETDSTGNLKRNFNRTETAKFSSENSQKAKQPLTAVRTQETTSSETTERPTSNAEIQNRLQSGQKGQSETAENLTDRT